MIQDLQGLNWSQPLNMVLIIGEDSAEGHTLKKATCLSPSIDLPGTQPTYNRGFRACVTLL